MVKEQIGQIWANKMIAELDTLFTNNPDWWQATTVIFAQLIGKNIKKNLFYVFFFTACLIIICM